MECSYKIKAYEKNQIKLYSVLGETVSRTVVFDIVEKSGVASAVSNAEITDLMLDLTGYTVILNMIGSSVSTAGTLTDAENGQVSFTLPGEFCKAVGEYQCEITLTKNNEKLCIIGIGLTVDYPVEESFDIEITAGITDTINLVLYDENGSIYTLQSGETIVFKAKKNIYDSQFALEYSVTSSARSGDGYDIVFDSADTAALIGDYHYGVGLQDSGGLHEVIPDAILTVKQSVLS